MIEDIPFALLWLLKKYTSSKRETADSGKTESSGINWNHRNPSEKQLIQGSGITWNHMESLGVIGVTWSPWSRLESMESLRITRIQEKTCPHKKNKWLQTLESFGVTWSQLESFGINGITESWNQLFPPWDKGKSRVMVQMTVGVGG